MSTVKFNNIENFSTAHGRTIPAARDMSLRDYFAAKAMQATVSTNVAISIVPGLFHREARMAYAIADAMLEARSA